MRPAYRSREAGKEADRACPRAPPRHARPVAFSCRGPMVAPSASIVPPLAAAERDRRPRVGDRGPALLALEDGTVFPGIAFGAAAGGRRRSRRQHQPDRLPGGLHRPLVRRPGRRDDLSARSATTGGCVDDDQSVRPWLRGARRRERDGRGRRRRPPARALLRGEGIPAIAGRRHAGARPASPGQRLASAAIVTEPGRSTATRPSTAPGRCRAGRTRTSSARCRRRRSRDVGDGASTAGRSIAIVDFGLKANIVRALRPARRAGPDPAPHGRRRRRAGRRHRRRSSCRPGPGDPARLDGPVALARAAIDDGRPLLGICLGHQIVARAAGADTRRLRFGHHGANHPVRDVDTGLVQVTAQNHEVQVVGETAAARRRLPRQPGQPQRRLGRGPAPPRPADRDGPVPPRGRARAARRAGRVRPVRGGRAIRRASAAR